MKLWTRISNMIFTLQTFGWSAASVFIRVWTRWGRLGDAHPVGGEDNQSFHYEANVERTRRVCESRSQKQNLSWRQG